jgi:multicomponent Na+:H+ antiporter subunit B
MTWDTSLLWQFDILILLMMVICAVTALALEGLLSSAIVTGAYSFLICLMWTHMMAVDVAFTEAAVGAAISTVIFLGTAQYVNRWIKKDRPKEQGIKQITLVISVICAVLMLNATLDLPEWADPASPASIHLSPGYIEQGYFETATPNVVTAVLADYRSYDTMFEAVVVFAAALVVMVILRRTSHKHRKVLHLRPKREGRDTVLRGAAQSIIPVMQIFALYVLCHGHYSPGGGFQGGVIFGASFILLALCYNLKFSMNRFREHAVLWCCAGGVLLYAGIGAACLAMGWNFLGYEALAGVLGVSEVMARSHGILAVEVGVGITVMAVMVSLYYDLASGGDLEDGL